MYEWGSVLTPPPRREGLRDCPPVSPTFSVRPKPPVVPPSKPGSYLNLICSLSRRLPRLSGCVHTRMRVRVRCGPGCKGSVYGRAETAPHTTSHYLPLTRGLSVPYLLQREGSET